MDKYILELHIVVKDNKLMHLENIEEKLVNLVLQEELLETSFEIAGGIRRVENGEKES